MFLDFETRSRCNLPREGGWRYAAHGSSEILCGVALDARTDPAIVRVWSPWSGPLTTWHLEPAYLEQLNTPADALVYAEPYLESDEPPPEVLEAADAGVPIVAHNAEGFDRLVWEQLGLGSAVWRDSLLRARRRGLPGGLNALGQRLYGLGKDKAGALTMRHASQPQHRRCKARKGGECDCGFFDPDNKRLSAIVRYCLRDVMLMAAAWYDEGLGDPHADDPALAAHAAIDRRGVQVDLTGLRLLREAQEEHQKQCVRIAEEASDGEVTLTTLRSPTALMRWLERQGVCVADVTAPTIQELLSGGGDGKA